MAPYRRAAAVERYVSDIKNARPDLSARLESEVKAGRRGRPAASSAASTPTPGCRWE